MFNQIIWSLNFEYSCCRMTSVTFDVDFFKLELLCFQSVYILYRYLYIVCIFIILFLISGI